MGVFALCLIWLVLYLCYLVYDGFRRPSSFPPGPRKLPFFGTERATRGKGHITVYSSKWNEKFGPVIGYFKYGHPIVVINDPKIGREVFSQQVFAGRLNSWVNMKAKSFGKSMGILQGVGDSWKNQRKFALRILRTFGFGKKGAEGIIQEQALALVAHLRKNNDINLWVSNLFNTSMLNIMMQMVASEQFEIGNEKVQRIFELLNGNVVSNRRLLYFLPWFHILVPGLGEMSGYNERKRLYDELHALIRKWIVRHQETRDRNDPRDFIDKYLNELEKPDHTEDFSIEQLIVVIMDLFVAGSETTSSTLKWALLFMVLNPEVQERCRDEVWTNVGRSRPPSLKDSDILPYCEATINEIQRLGSIAPAGLAHRNEEDTYIGEYRIPKGTLSVINLYHIFYSQDFFDEPERFLPERFLNDDQTRVKHIEAFIPFGVGKRICMGEHLARNELFLFFTTLLQNFKMKMPVGDGVVKPDKERFNIGLIRMPKDYHISVVPI